MSGDGKSGVRRPRPIGRPQVPPGPLADLKALLYELYLAAGMPTLDQVTAAVAQDGELAGAPGRDTIARVIGDAGMPASQADVVAVATVLARAARWAPADAADRARDLWVAARMGPARSQPAGVRVSEADPRLLGVHAAISAPGMPDEALPEYVPRDADAAGHGVQDKVGTAAERGGFVLLVGGSSVGKTRSAYEAVRALLPEWRLLHPAGPAEVAALAQAPPSQTVVWLDELQRCLGGEHGLTGATLRALLNAPCAVVIVGTLWPDLYAAYTAVPAPGRADPHARERELLDLAAVIRIDPEFSQAEQDRARAAAEHDPRLRLALSATGYGLTQTLAAAPQLVARWQDAQTASPYAWAVLTAALDAARLGARAPLTADFLRSAAPGYCTSQQQAEAPDNWFEQALAYATGKLHGAAAALSPAGAGMGQIAGYITADYLIQHASRGRRAARLPASTWDAFLSFIRDPADAARLADSAERRLLYRHAIALYRHAVDAGGQGVAEELANLLAKRGELGELRARAIAGDEAAADYLASLLVDAGDPEGAEQVLRAVADAGNGAASEQLASLLARRGDPEGAEQVLRAAADAGNGYAALRLARLLAGRGDLDGLRARADAGDQHATELLTAQGEMGQLRALADGGDRVAAAGLARLLTRSGNLDGAEQVLRPLADGGDKDAAWQLADLLTRSGDLDGAEQLLRAAADAGDGFAAWQLARLLATRGNLACDEDWYRILSHSTRSGRSPAVGGRLVVR